MMRVRACDLSRRTFLVTSAGISGVCLVGCAAGVCTPPHLPEDAGVTDNMTFGEIRLCREERDSVSLHGVSVTLPPDAPSIISDYRTALDVDLRVRPFRHTGIDIAGVDGSTPVIAAMDGLVEEATSRRSGGNQVALYHGTDVDGRDVMTMYFHMSTILVAAYQQVARGDVLGFVGVTGTTSGRVPHLHFNMFVAAHRRGRHFLDYFYSAHVNPHYYWHDGPGRVTLFRSGGSYTRRLGATYPVPGRSEMPFFERFSASTD
jgi:hypothetical protein